MSALPERAGVVVAGGGVMGASIAFHLAEAGVVDVLLLERGELAGGSTTKSAGGVRAQFSDAVNIALGARSLEAFERFGERPGAEIDLHQVGYLFLHTSPESMAAAERAVDLQRSMGVPTQLLTAEEAGRRSPGVEVGDVLGATFHGRDGYCTPEAVVQGYVKAARALGATVRTGVDVQEVLTRGGEVAGVMTSAGPVAADAVVCATGAWAQGLAATAGVHLPVEPLKRQIVVTEPLDDDLLALFPRETPMTIDAATTFYLHREGPGLLVGMSYQRETPGFDESYDEAWLPDLLEAMERRAPRLLDVGLAYRWGGLYEVTPDHNALIGAAHDVGGFLYATGFSGHGFLQGPAVGEVIRDLHLGREPVIDVSSLDARRFEAGATVHERAIV